MAARTTKNTVKRVGSKVRPSFKRLRVTSKTAAILRRLRIKQRKTQRKSNSNDWKANVCNELSTMQFKQAQLSDLMRKSQQQLSRLEFQLNVIGTALYRAGASWEKEFETLPAICESPNESAPV